MTYKIEITIVILFENRFSILQKKTIRCLPKYFYFFIGIALALCSCRSDFETVANRRFSVFKDTIYLDTVFSNIGSSTYRLKVYNKSKMTSTIPSIKLGKGLSSKYRMTIDGMQGTAGKIFYKCSAVSKRWFVCFY
jgi:hypothetical protein